MEDIVEPEEEPFAPVKPSQTSLFDLDSENHAVRPQTDPSGMPYAEPWPEYSLPDPDQVLLHEEGDLEGAQKRKEEAEKTKAAINQVYTNFNINAWIASYQIGPTVTRYYIDSASDVPTDKLNKNNKDISKRVNGRPVSFVEAIEGSPYSAFDIANESKETINFLEVYNAIEGANKVKTQVPYGKTADGEIFSSDIAKAPHMLVCGATRSGKSVYVHSLICTILMRNRPEEAKFIMIDPKYTEFSKYDGIPHLLCPVITEVLQAKNAFKKVIDIMQERLKALRGTGCRNAFDYNMNYAPAHGTVIFPTIYVIVDEYADLTTVDKNIGQYIARLGAKARAAAISLVIATQRPTADVISGTLKNNLPVRVALSVKSPVDSQTILNSSEAAYLVGNGDMIVQGAGTLRDVRAQGCYLRDQEIEDIIAWCKKEQAANYDPRFSNLDVDEEEEEEVERTTGSMAARPSIEEAKAATDEARFQMLLESLPSRTFVSVSAIQREYGLGYNHASKMVERLKREGLIDPDAINGKGYKVIGKVEPEGGINPGSTDQEVRF